MRSVGLKFAWKGTQAIRHGFVNDLERGGAAIKNTTVHHYCESSGVREKTKKAISKVILTCLFLLLRSKQVYFTLEIALDMYCYLAIATYSLHTSAPTLSA